MESQTASITRALGVVRHGGKADLIRSVLATGRAPGVLPARALDVLGVQPSSDLPLVDLLPRLGIASWDVQLWVTPWWQGVVGLMEDVSAGRVETGLRAFVYRERKVLCSPSGGRGSACR